MKFWDSSAVVALLFDEPARAAATRLYESDPEMIVWWATPIEVMSAAARRRHDGHLTPAGETLFASAFDELADQWKEVAPESKLRATAKQLLWEHPLRAADAFQLAAALVVAESESATLDFVCLDQRLAAAARREGFSVLP